MLWWWCVNWTYISWTIAGWIWWNCSVWRCDWLTVWIWWHLICDELSRLSCVWLWVSHVSIVRVNTSMSVLWASLCMYSSMSVLWASLCDGWIQVWECYELVCEHSDKCIQFERAWRVAEKCNECVVILFKFCWLLTSWMMIVLSWAALESYVLSCSKKNKVKTEFYV